MRRGSSTTTSPETISSSAGGTRVVLPAPGGASITRLGERLRDSMISGRIASTGRTGLLFTNFHRNTATRTRQRDGTWRIPFPDRALRVPHVRISVHGPKKTGRSPIQRSRYAGKKTVAEEVDPRDTWSESI